MFSSNDFLKELLQRGVQIEEGLTKSGGNSRLYLFRFEGKDLVLKVYLGDKARIEASKSREESAYRFLHENRFLCLPQLATKFEVDDGICIEYIKGEEPEQNEQTNRRIQESFLQLQEIYKYNKTFDNAIDAAFSSNDLVKQIESRLNSFNYSLSEEFSNLRSVVASLKRKEIISFPAESLTYSFSDVGAHNMIKQMDKYYFIDFEFFGKDSAIKMFLDYLLHPRNKVSRQERLKNLRFAESYFHIDLDLILEVAPLVAAKWAAIVARRIMLDYTQNDLATLKSAFRRYVEIATLDSKDEVYAEITSAR